MPIVKRRRRLEWPTYQIEEAVLPTDAPADQAWPKLTAASSTAPASTELAFVGQQVSQAQLSKRLGLSIATLARRRREGALAGHKMGGVWRFTEQQIADYLKRTEQPLRLYGRLLNDNDMS